MAFLEEIKINNCINDSNSILLLFCQSLEKIFSLGLLPCHNTFGLFKYVDPWVWLEKITHNKNSDISYSYSHCVDNAKLCRNVITNIGRLRLLIRLCLVYKCIHIPLEYLVSNYYTLYVHINNTVILLQKNQKKLNSIYRENSIVGDEILCEILLSVLRQCCKINFKLNSNNTSFLDYSWIMPEVVKIEYVPCDMLGMTVR